MQLRSLLLTHDDDIVEVLRRALTDLGIGAEVYSSSDWALQDLQRQKFDAVIIDCDVDGSSDLLRSIRSTPSSSRALTFAIVNRDLGVQPALNLGANLALEKPVTLEQARSSLRAAYGLMMLERRRYFRYSIYVPVTLYPDDRTSFLATAVNISEGGISLKANAELQMNAFVKFAFHLPGISSEIEGRGVVVWKDAGGRAGIRFEQMAAPLQQKLCDWLAQRARES